MLVGQEVNYKVLIIVKLKNELRNLNVHLIVQFNSFQNLFFKVISVHENLVITGHLFYKILSVGLSSEYIRFFFF